MAVSLEKTCFALVSQDVWFRKTVEGLCEKAEDVCLTAWDETCESLLRMRPTPRVHVVLIEINDPQCGEAEAARAFLADPWRVPLIALTPTLSDSFLACAATMGASDVLLKKASAERLFSAIRQVHAGEQPIVEHLLRNPGAVSTVLAHWRLPIAPVVRSDGRVLTSRDIETLALAAGGYSNKEIADRLWVSVQTVKNRMTTIMRKTQTRDRTHAVVYALRNRWIQPP